MPKKCIYVPYSQIVLKMLLAFGCGKQHLGLKNVLEIHTEAAREVQNIGPLL